MRAGMRGLVNKLTQIGIPAGRIALQLQFNSSPGLGARAGLQPASAWFEIVKLESLAAQQVVKEFKIAGVWSWGWATFNANAPLDPDKPAAACVWLWARDPYLCDGPAAAGAGLQRVARRRAGRAHRRPRAARCPTARSTAAPSAGSPR